MTLTLETAQLVPASAEAVVGEGYELVDGQLVEKTMGAEASSITAKLAELLGPHVSSQKLGLVFVSECGYQIFKKDPKKVRKPDLSFIARGRLPNNRPPRGNVTIPPDLAVEVISPNDLTEDTDLRVDDYLKAGTKLMWLLYAQTGSVWVVRQDGSAVRLQGEQELSGENVVPGFACQVRALFQSLESS